MSRTLINIMLVFLCIVAGPAIAASQDVAQTACIRAKAAQLL
jgi:hypothetical protein